RWTGRRGRTAGERDRFPDRPCLLAVGGSWFGIDPARRSCGHHADVRQHGAEPGSYDARIRITTNIPHETPAELPVHLLVSSGPRLVVQDPVLDFGSVPIGFDSTLTLGLTNIGDESLVIQSLTPGSSDFSVSESSMQLDPLASQQV